MRWRVGLIDSCGAHARAVATAAFNSEHDKVSRSAPGPDVSGHGSRIAALLCGSIVPPDLLLAQVFRGRLPASAAAIGAAIDWCVAEGANLVHLSLGLSTDREVLRTAVTRALNEGAVLVAATPARGGPVFPAAYVGVIRGTGDARCGPGELSVLGDGRFGAHRILPGAVPGQGGASAGAAWLSRAIMELPPGATPAQCTQELELRANYRGPERRLA